MGCLMIRSLLPLGAGEDREDRKEEEEEEEKRRGRSEVGLRNAVGKPLLKPVTTARMA